MRQSSMKLRYGLAAVMLTSVLTGCGAERASSEHSERRVAGATTACPDALPESPELWVPEEFDADRLVPERVPTSGMICEYEGRGFGPAGERAPKLTGTKQLASGLERIPDDLMLPQKLPGQDRACTLIGSALVPYLMRLDYPEGSVWVTSIQDANSCQDTTSGKFTSGVYLGGRLQESYQAGAWVAPSPPPAPGCFSQASGRSGQEDELVPAGWSRITACRSEVNQGAPVGRALTLEEARELVEILENVSTTPGSGGCSGGGDVNYILLVEYPTGPSVGLGFSPGCDPPLRNSSLDATFDQESEKRLAELLERVREPAPTPEPAVSPAGLRWTGAEVCVSQAEGEPACRQVDAAAAAELSQAIDRRSPERPGQGYCRAAGPLYRVQFQHPSARTVPWWIPTCGPMTTGFENASSSERYVLDPASLQTVKRIAAEEDPGKGGVDAGLIEECVGREQAQEAPGYVGLTEAAARGRASAAGGELRVVGRDGECLGREDDLRVQRVNVILRDERVVWAGRF